MIGKGREWERGWESVRGEEERRGRGGLGGSYCWMIGKKERKRKMGEYRTEEDRRGKKKRRV